MEQLYLLEILVEKVKFGPNVADVPDRKDVRIGVRFANLVDIDILSEDLTGFLKQDGEFAKYALETFEFNILRFRPVSKEFGFGPWKIALILVEGARINGNTKR